jgi:hypothetical protein
MTATGVRLFFLERGRTGLARFLVRERDGPFPFYLGPLIQTRLGPVSIPDPATTDKSYAARSRRAKQR